MNQQEAIKRVEQDLVRFFKENGPIPYDFSGLIRIQEFCKNSLDNLYSEINQEKPD